MHKNSLGSLGGEYQTAILHFRDIETFSEYCKDNAGVAYFDVSHLVIDKM